MSSLKRFSAKNVLKTKVILRSGVIIEMKIWKLSKIDYRYPDGFKYSLYAIYNERILIGYDNHYPKSHHKHIGNKEKSYNFTTLQRLKSDFKADVDEQLRREGIK